MILQLVEIKEFKKMSNGVSKFVSYKNNGRLYILKMKKAKNIQNILSMYGLQ